MWQAVCVPWAGVPPSPTSNSRPGFHPFFHWHFRGWKVSISLAQSFIWWPDSLLREAEQGLWSTFHRGRDEGPGRLRIVPKVTQFAEPKAGIYRSVKFKGNSGHTLNVWKTDLKFPPWNFMLWTSTLLLWIFQPSLRRTSPGDVVLSTTSVA